MITAPHTYLYVSLVCLILIGCSGEAGPRPVPVSIEKQDGKFLLFRDDVPIYLEGATVGDATALPDAPSGVENPISMLKNAGANAARVASDRAVLDSLDSHNMLGVVDLILKGERDGMNWDDDKMVNAQAEWAIATVRELKDHPAVAMWVLGNEIDYIPPNEPYNPRIWKRLNDLATRIKEIDPNHLVLTIVGNSYFETKIKELARDGTSFDLLGLNAYGALAETTASLQNYWPKPYIVTEWGATGHWEVPRTIWGAPIEETSSEKAVAIDNRYRKVIKSDSAHCLGSFIFYWSEKQETTHTWYGLFTEQKRTQAIDVMQYHWQGRPSNLAPTVVSFELNDTSDKKAQVLLPDVRHSAHIKVLDIDSDSLFYDWDIRPEVVIPEKNYAGRKESRAPVLKDFILQNGQALTQFKTPHREGAYRLFVSVHDGQGSIAYANFPFYVSRTGKYTSSKDRHL